MARIELLPSPFDPMPHQPSGQIDEGIVVQLSLAESETRGRRFANRESLFGTKDDVVRRARRQSHLPANAEIEREITSQLPRVLSKEIVFGIVS